MGNYVLSRMETKAIWALRQSRHHVNLYHISTTQAPVVIFLDVCILTVHGLQTGQGRTGLIRRPLWTSTTTYSVQREQYYKVWQMSYVLCTHTPATASVVDGKEDVIAVGGETATETKSK